MKQNLFKTWLMLLCLFIGIGGAWADTYVQLTSIASIDESAEYVLGIDGTGFHKSGTSSWGVCTNSGGGTPLKYKLVKATDGTSFKASTVIGTTTYYLAVPTSNTFTMATSSTATNTDMIIGTTQVSGTNYAVANKGTTARHLRLNGTSGLRSYAGTTGNMAFFYKVVADGPTVSSISIKTAPTKTTYMEGEKFDPTGLVITKTLSDANTEDVAYSGNESSFTFSPSLNTELSNETSVSITYGGKTTAQAITVNPFVATAGTYNIVPNNVFWGKSTQDGSKSVTANTTFGPVEKYGVTFEMNSGKSTNSYMKSDHSRAYDGYTLKLTAPSGFNLTAIEFTGSTWAAPIANVGTVNSKKWTGETGEVIFSFSGTSYMSNIKVTYSTSKTLQSVTVSGTPTKTTYTAGESFDPAGLTVTGHYDDESDETITEGITWSTPAALTAGQTSVNITATVKGITSAAYNVTGLTVNAPVTLSSIAVTGTPTEFWKGEAFNHNGITVTATWSDDSQTDVTSSATFSGYDMSTAGQQTVTVTYQGKTTTYNIEVKTIANTQATAYTVAEAKALIDAGKDLTTEVYVKGIVSQIVTPWNEQYSNITYNISDDGETTGLQFQLFRCTTNGGEVGDAVVAKGTMTFYSQTSTYEFTSGNTIVDIQKPTAKTITALEVSGTPTKTTYNVGDAFETAGLVVTATYSDATQEVISTGFEWEIDYGTGNEAFVAGATSVDVMVYTDEVMSEVYTVEGLTVTIPVTLTSIAVSGTPTKTEYYAGDAFETAGLVVTGTYSDSHQETITEGIEWTIDPETLTLGTTSVDVMAGVGSVVSEVYTVEGLTVTENPVKTATKNGFTTGDNNGSHNFTDNTDISFEAFKGNAGTAPAIPNRTTYLRLYQNGGYVTIKGAAGVTISQVKITTGSTYESTTVGYCVDDEDAPTTGETVAKSSDYTITNLNNQSVSIYCLGTTSSTRLDIAAIEVKYTKENITLSSIALSGEYQTEFIQNQTFNHDGIVVTASFSNGQNEDVTSKAEFTNPDMTTTGTKTITVSYTDGDITKTADYEITVAEEVVTALTLSGEYQTTFRAGDEFNHDNLIIEATYNSGRTGIDVTSTATISTPDMSIEGEQTITISYGGQSTSYTIKILSENTIFYESFDTNNGTGGNDGQWSGSIASNNISSDNEGWNFASSGGANKCAKFGTGSAAGLATTPALGYEGDAIMTFKSAAWNSNNETLKVNLSVEGEGEISQTSITNKKGEWTTYTVLLTGLTAESRVKFEAANASNNRFFLDEILITTSQSIDLVATDGENYYATFSSTKDVEFVDAEVYTITVANDQLSLNEVEGKQVPAGQGVLIKTTTNKATYKNITEATTLGDNYLVACPTTGTCPEVEGDNLYYKLAYGNANANTGLGFWYGAEGGSNNFNVKAGGAVLVVPQSVGGSVRGFSFDGNNGVVTGLNNLNNLNNTKSTIYNLQGQHISKAQKGVSIVNGRKVIR